MKNYTYNLGMNKGNSRIWIEGNTLLNEGFKCGDRFDKLNLDPNKVMIDTRPPNLVLVFHNKGKSKIAGNASRPIIDLNGKFLNSIFEGFKKYHLRFGLQGNMKAIFIDAVI